MKRNGLRRLVQLQGGAEDRVFGSRSPLAREIPDLEITLEPDDGDPDHTGPTVMEASFTLPRVASHALAEPP